MLFVVCLVLLVRRCSLCVVWFVIDRSLSFVACRVCLLLIGPIFPDLPLPFVACFVLFVVC